MLLVALSRIRWFWHVRGPGLGGGTSRCRGWSADSAGLCGSAGRSAVPAGLTPAGQAAGGAAGGGCAAAQERPGGAWWQRWSSGCSAGAMGRRSNFGWRWGEHS